ncbi:MAG: tetratricopeptide repeat protein [Myxococcota bacterium]
MSSRASSDADAPASTDNVKMEPVVVRAAPEPVTGLDGYDAQQLLEVGNQKYANKAYKEAVEVYELLLSSFETSDLVPSAIYNKGLAYEQLGRFESAYEAFARIVDEYPMAPSHKQAQFRVAFNLGKLQRWQGVADAFWAIRQRKDISPMDELEARVGQGVAMFMMDDYATAEREFLSALRFYEKESKLQYLPAEYWVGQSRFYLGEINARAFEKLTLSPPTNDDPDWARMMGRELEEKCQLLLRAQNNFIRTIRVGHSGWATAAGYRIGSLYEKLYDDLVDLPVPTDLKDDARSVYRDELRDRVSVLVMKAIKVYESSLQMARRVG